MLRHTEGFGSHLRYGADTPFTAIREDRHTAVAAAVKSFMMADARRDGGMRLF
ncbi:hypothetical protein MXD81_48490 [Microbacteriaceae bacterium K1510]|jgi:hypothetical protein|nr:hypothetical protein [Microbacteriaceae bacterium K1510]|tara:strand:+ start:160 stop:318 length:159 start_codon:yes stop_codon:yes gene_type:complete